MFQLAELEYKNLWCQFDISKEQEHGGRRILPFAFTEGKKELEYSTVKDFFTVKIEGEREI